MTGVGYIELEAPDVTASIQFYTTVLGFELMNRSGRHAVQATLKMASGQTLILTQAPFSSKGLRHEPQSAGTAYRFLRTGCELERRAIAVGGSWASPMATAVRPRSATMAKAARTWTIPAGYVIQYITDGME